MSDQKAENQGLITELTPQEQAVLLTALKRLETDLFHAVLKRFSYYLIAAVVILTLAGIVNFYALSDKIESSAVEKITSDPGLRDKVITQASELEKENARAVSTFVGDLKEINSMIKQVRDDLSQRFPTTNNKPKNPKVPRAKGQ